MPNKPPPKWPEATAFVEMILSQTGLTISGLENTLAKQPGMSASRAHQVYRWYRGGSRPSFPYAMELLYAAGMIERPVTSNRPSEDEALAELNQANEQARALRQPPRPRRSRRADQG